MTNLPPYKLSFTAGGLLLKESVELAGLYLLLGDWGKARTQAQRDNLVQSKMASSSVRVCREICQRLALLSREELQVLLGGTLQEQQQLLWVAICRNYRFIREFAVEVIREKFLQLNLDLRQEDYDAFFNAKAQWHDELEELRDSTRCKLRQVVFRMLREADILSRNDTINPTLLGPRVARLIAGTDPADLRVFPLSERDVSELLK